MSTRTDHRDPDAHVHVGRLDTGWSMIDRELDPERKERLEDHWIALLHEYETACDGADHRPEHTFALNDSPEDRHDD